jgi:hypothetical protein
MFFYLHFNNHIIKYYKINRIFTYQFNDETQLVRFYLCCVFNTEFGYVDMCFSFIAICPESKCRLLLPCITEMQRQEFKSKKDIRGKGAQPRKEF